MNIYKYKLDLTQAQSIKCRAIKILDIQIQNGNPVMWVMEKADAEEKEIGIVMQPTGMDVMELIEDLTYVSTTQDTEGLVWHWFTDIDFDYTQEEQSCQK